MSAKATITNGEYKRIRRLLYIAQQEIASLYRTKQLIANMLPQVAGLGIHVDEVVDHNLSSKELLRRMDVRVRGKK